MPGTLSRRTLLLGLARGVLPKLGTLLMGLRAQSSAPLNLNLQWNLLTLNSFRFLNHPATESTDDHGIKGRIVLEPVMRRFLLWVQHQPLHRWRPPVQGLLGVLRSSLPVGAGWGTTRFFTRPVCLCVMWPYRTLLKGVWMILSPQCKLTWERREPSGGKQTHNLPSLAGTVQTYSHQIKPFNEHFLFFLCF